MTDLPTTDETRKVLALHAACSAAEAVAELTRYAQDGPNYPGAFGHFGIIDVVEKLAYAMKIAIDIEQLPNDPERDQVRHALFIYLDGWRP